MSDLISRQAVIKEFSCCELTPDGGIDVNYAIDFLKQLPSAQPQPEEDCDTCKHGYFGDRQCDNCRVRYPSHYEREEEQHEGSD